MQFGKAQNRRFGTLDGAYSFVTDREHYDSQITLTDYEAELVLRHFGNENIHVGNVQSNPTKASKQFKLFPDGELISLNLVFPKPDKPELRLYLSATAGFKPVGGNIWFVFVVDGEIWIGQMDEASWRSNSSILKTDDYDDLYQLAVNEDDVIRITTLTERDVYQRDSRLALKRMAAAGFACEYDGKHKLFVSRFSRRNYVEAHHLIPLGLQAEFRPKLDMIENIYCLCTFCHRAVHHADEPLAREILGTLSEKRNVLDYYGLGLKDLFSLYAVEEID
ncbi:hypothetical protein BH10ACI3_BH10ACI3_26590 [soil metagenome]